MGAVRKAARIKSGEAAPTLPHVSMSDNLLSTRTIVPFYAPKQRSSTGHADSLWKKADATPIAPIVEEKTRNGHAGEGQEHC
jgi:hypothetical protein